MALSYFGGRNSESEPQLPLQAGQGLHAPLKTPSITVVSGSGEPRAGAGEPRAGAGEPLSARAV